MSKPTRENVHEDRSDYFSLFTGFGVYGVWVKWFFAFYSGDADAAAGHAIFWRGGAVALHGAGFRASSCGRSDVAGDAQVRAAGVDAAGSGDRQHRVISRDYGAERIACGDRRDYFMADSGLSRAVGVRADLAAAGEIRNMKVAAI